MNPHIHIHSEDMPTIAGGLFLVLIGFINGMAHALTRAMKEEA